ncbi:hypothetical protein [Marinifilum fragile]|uniref:hypothetical protein n=1 Tax=Marinifilum fragile TaxID=570161 RepID=UPI0006D13FC9|nr:hypothetical protein [Marinifilum fragile]
MKKLCIIITLISIAFYNLAGVIPPPGQTSITISTEDDRRSDPNPDLQLNKNLLTITGTGKLMVRNLVVDNNSDVVIQTNGVLIIEGDLITENKMTIEAGGTLIVLGNFVHTGSDTNQGGFTSSDPSNVYILGSIDGSDDGNHLNPNLYPVLQCDGAASNDGLTDYQNNCNFGGEEDLMINPIYQAICGVNFSGGEITSDQEICLGNEPSGLLNVLPATTSGNATTFTYQWYYTTKLNSDPKTDLISWTLIENAEYLDYTSDIGPITQTTFFVRQASKGAGCVTYSNIITIDVVETPNPIGIFNE